MPDQSLSNDDVSGKTGQEAGNPADTTANSPTQATPESLESNVTRASEGQQQQADVTINQDPTVSTGDVQTVGTQSSGLPDDLDDEEAHPYREVQKLAKARGVDAGGKREEIVARLRSQSSSGTSESGGSEQPRHLQGMETIDASPSDTPDVPRTGVDAQVFENGGIQKTARGQDHAEVLQGLSAERRQQQLAAVAARSAQSGSSSDKE